MQQIKIFKGVASELESLEADINQWIRDNGVVLVSMTGNIAPQTRHSDSHDSFPVSDIVVIVTYEASDV